MHCHFVSLEFCLKSKFVTFVLTPFESIALALYAESTFSKLTLVALATPIESESLTLNEPGAGALASTVSFSITNFRVVAKTPDLITGW
jgi:hypothetical protein